MRLFFLLLTQTSLVFAHGSLHEQIKALTTRIAATPDNPQLYLDRADLHKSHRDIPAARTDILQATKVKPPFPPAFLKLAQFERKQSRSKVAQAALKKYFTLVPVSKLPPLAHREKALLSSPKNSLDSWRPFLAKNESATMHDFALAVRAALDVPDLKTARSFLTTGLLQHPKSIKLHQLHARLFLLKNDPQAADNSFKTLRQLYPNLFVKLHYEESLIRAQHNQPDRSRQALLASLNAFSNLPPRLQKNRDLKALVTRIKTTLRK